MHGGGCMQAIDSGRHLSTPRYHVSYAQPTIPLYVRLSTQMLYMEALPRRDSANTYATNTTMNAPVGASMTFEEVVSATLIQIDRRREDDAAYLGLLRCANDEETLERLLGKAFEQVAEQGCSLLLGPTGILPGWNPGALVNHYNRRPPWHTPYNPPYVGELLASIMEPWLETELYTLEVPTDLPPAPTPAAHRATGAAAPGRRPAAAARGEHPPGRSISGVRPTRSRDPDRLAAGERAARGLAGDGRRHASGVHHAAGGPGAAAAAYGWRQALARNAATWRCAVILARPPAGCCWEPWPRSGEARGLGCSCGATRLTGHANWDGRRLPAGLSWSNRTRPHSLHGKARWRSSVMSRTAGRRGSGGRHVR